ncbi:MAG TPA: DUF1194 domain-containing protein, partial [Acetobacteraceae bacterium]|nr:DUF1194 domain-containing protein [Acetobacteraceae bacterium]
MTLRRRLLLRTLALAPLAAVSPPVHAADAVDLLLVLAVDASGSVDMGRFNLQKHGYAEAFRSNDVIAAIAGGARQAIGVTMLQWTGPALHRQVVPWTLAHDAASAHGLADAIDAAERALFRGGTSISGAIDEAMRLFAAAPFAADRRTIDVSGDGANSSGRASADARDEAVARGVTINGLPILTLEPDLDDFYRS